MLAALWPTAGCARMSATDLPCGTANSLKTSTPRDSGYILQRLQRDIPPTTFRVTWWCRVSLCKISTKLFVVDLPLRFLSFTATPFDIVILTAPTRSSASRLAILRTDSGLWLFWNPHATRWNCRSSSLSLHSHWYSVALPGTMSADDVMAVWIRRIAIRQVFIFLLSDEYRSTTRGTSFLCIAVMAVWMTYTPTTAKVTIQG